MPDQVDTATLHHAVEQLAHALDTLAAQAGDAPAVRRLCNDLERIRIDLADCGHLHQVPPARKLEVIPDTPYDQSLWKGVDDEGLGGFHQQPAPHTKSRFHR